MAVDLELIAMALFGVFDGVLIIQSIETFKVAMRECHDVMHASKPKILFCTKNATKIVKKTAQKAKANIVNDE